MPKKKAAEPQAAPAKKAPAKRASKTKDEPKTAKATKRSPVASKSAKPEAKPAKSTPKRKNAKHVDVPNETVLNALSSDKPFSKSELVAACGGDAVAVTKTIQRLRGLGQIVATGTSRSTVYTKTA